MAYIFTKKNNLKVILFRNLLKLSLGALVIGLLHDQDILVAFLLSLYLFFGTRRKIKGELKDEAGIFIAGTILTGVFGVVCECWGIYNGYWKYHDLNREFPVWLPIAWALAFGSLYRVEREIIISKNITSFSTKLLITIAIAIVFPTVGEMIAINLGVWTYYWDYQLLGVPLLAVLLLMIFHTGVYFLLSYICKKKNIRSIVFNSNS